MATNYETASVCTLLEMWKVIQDSRVISCFGSNFMWICDSETFTALTDIDLLQSCCYYDSVC